MPIKIPDHLPALEILQKENIFVMGESRAFHQDIRPLKIVILNLMPRKEITETQLLRLIGNSPLQAEVTFICPEEHTSKNTPQKHLDDFYKGFSDIKGLKYDGLIITGAPIEHLEFEEVTYWEELKTIMDWSATNVTSTLHICWGAQAGLYHHFGIPKYPLKEKMFGVFAHRVTTNSGECQKLLRGFDAEFYVPHSRHTEVKRKDIEQVPELEILAESDESGVYIVTTKGCRQIFVTGHSEYDLLTLKEEYERDLAKGLKISPPKNYWPADDVSQTPAQKWKAHANLLFSNWLNNVYQETPYNW